jgi:hypothetical protein
LEKKLANNFKESAIMALGGLTAILLVVAIFTLGPLFVVWALNTLFPILAIPYSFDSWCAVIVLAWFMRVKISVKG